MPATASRNTSSASSRRSSNGSQLVQNVQDPKPHRHRNGRCRRHPGHRGGHRRRRPFHPRSARETTSRSSTTDSSSRSAILPPRIFPLELVSVIDVSSSMRDSIAVVKEAAKRFLTGIAPADQVTRARVQREHLPAGAARDRSGGADARGRSHGSVGRHRALRRDHPGNRDSGTAIGKARDRRCSATATISRAMPRSTAPFARPRAATPPSTRSDRAGRYRRRRCRSCCGRLPPSAAAARSSPTIRKARFGLHRDSRGPPEPVL